MVVQFESTSKLRNLSKERQEIEGKLLSKGDTNISYLCKHTYDINVTIDPTLKIKDEDLYPEYVHIQTGKEKYIEINDVQLISIGDTSNP